MKTSIASIPFTYMAELTLARRRTPSIRVITDFVQCEINAYEAGETRQEQLEYNFDGKFSARVPYHIVDETRFFPVPYGNAYGYRLTKGSHSFALHHDVFKESEFRSLENDFSHPEHQSNLKSGNHNFYPRRIGDFLPGAPGYNSRASGMVVGMTGCEAPLITALSIVEHHRNDRAAQAAACLKDAKGLILVDGILYSSFYEPVVITEANDVGEITATKELALIDVRTWKATDTHTRLSLDHAQLDGTIYDDSGIAWKFPTMLVDIQETLRGVMERLNKISSVLTSMEEMRGLIYGLRWNDPADFDAGQARHVIVNAYVDLMEMLPDAKGSLEALRLERLMTTWLDVDMEMISDLYTAPLIRTV